jgi:hypothetical protein
VIAGICLLEAAVYASVVRAHLIDMPDDLWQKIGEAAKARGVSRSALVRSAVTRALAVPTPETARPAAAVDQCSGFVPQPRNALRCVNCGLNKAAHRERARTAF